MSKIMARSSYRPEKSRCSRHFYACMYGLIVFPDAVRAVYPQKKVQLCIVHMVRNSRKYVSYNDLKAVCHDLKQIYTALNEEEAFNALEDFGAELEQ